MSAAPKKLVSTGSPDATTVTVGVPRTAMIRVDPFGRVLAAWTNTGCPPSRVDQLWLHGPDGSIVIAPSNSIADFRWTGDFSESGRYVDQRRRES